MTEGDRPAVHVHLVLVDLEHPHGVDRHRGEGLVDLPEVDVGGLLADPVQRLHGGLRGGLGEVREVVCDLSVGKHRRDRALPVLLRPFLRGDDHGTGAVVDPRRVTGRVGRVVAADRLQLGESLEGRVGPDRLIGRDLVLALPRLDGDGDDLLRELAVLGRLVGELMRALGEAVHVRPGDLELVGDVAGLVDHLLLGEGVGESVVGHRVDRSDVTHAEAEPGSRQEVGRLAHRLHAAGDADVEIAGPDRLVGDPDRAHAGCADLVDGLRGHLARDTGLDLRLSGGDLALPGLEHLAVDDALDLVGIHLGAVERLRDRGASQVGGIEGGESAAHLPERGPGGGEDDRLRHLRLSSGPTVVAGYSQVPAQC